MPAPKGKIQEKNQNIQVVVRCRPTNDKEVKQGSHNVVELDVTRNEVNVRDRLAPVNTPRTFSFDKVFGPQSKQLEVYKTIVVPIIEEVLLGYNCTVFAYGQTGTGKTYTMEGERTINSDVSWEEDPECGIIPRAMGHLFSRLSKQGCEFSVRVSFLEIYNEELIDLLGAESVDSPKLKVYEDVMKKGSCVVQGLEEVVVQSKDQVYTILQTGTARRQTAATLLNAHSSRSHTLFMVTVHMKENSDDGEELVKTGKLNLVDLAGSECIGRSGAVDKRAREAGNINMSLLTLGRVITSLVEHAPHVPYRESKLTRLLQDSLGGRTKTSIIATFSPSSLCLEETISTLEYAQRAKSIMNRPEINQKLSKRTLIKEYTEEIERLRKDLQASRDKNGIFLAEENFNDMQSRLLQQKDQIDEQEELIATKEAELLKITQLFDSTKQTLEERTEDLRVTREVLGDTRVQLHDTCVTLKDTVREREEQRHLVTEHVKTETSLHGQATTLLAVTTETVGDVGGLHAKIDRKRAVEDHNADAQQQFWSVYNTANNALRTQLLSHITAQADTNKGLQQHLKLLSQSEAEAHSSVETAISGVQTQVSQQMAALTAAFDGLAAHGHSAAGEQCTAAQSALTECVKQCEQYVTAVFSQALLHMRAKYELVLSQRQLVTSLLETQKAAQQKEMATFCDGLLDQVDATSELVRVFATQQRDLLDKRRREVTDFIEGEKDYDSMKKAEILAAVGTLLDELFAEKSTNLSRNASEAYTFIDKAVEALNKHEATHNGLTDDLCDQVETGRDQQTEMVDKHETERQPLLNEIDNAVKTLHEQTASLETQTVSFVNTEQAHWQKASDDWQTASKKLAGDVQCRMTDVTAMSQTLEAQLKEEMDALVAASSSHSTAAMASCTEQTSVLVSQWEHIGQHGRDTDAGLLQLVDDVQTFLQQDLHRDMPTGTTPQRKEYQYPRILSQTEPHDKLIERFRLTYVAEEDGVVIPTFNSLDSAKQTANTKDSVVFSTPAESNLSNARNLAPSISSLDDFSDASSVDNSDAKFGGSGEYPELKTSTSGEVKVTGSVEKLDTVANVKENMQPPQTTRLPTAKKVRDTSGDRAATRTTGNVKARQKLPLQLANP